MAFENHSIKDFTQENAAKENSSTSVSMFNVLTCTDQKCYKAFELPAVLHSKSLLKL